MSEIIKRKKVLLPTSVDLPSKRADRRRRMAEDLFAFAHSIYNDPKAAGDNFEKMRIPTYHWDPWMRKMGYTRNPATCSHTRKRFEPLTSAWICMDCGDGMGEN